MPFLTANEMYVFMLRDLLENGERSSPRGMPVREHLNRSFTLMDPRRSIIGLSGRALNYHFMVGEALWMLCGLNRADLIKPFNRNIVMALDDKQDVFQGAYGPKIMDQLPYVLEILREDPDSRQAVLTIWRERPRVTKDVPCTVMMQFLLRRGLLHMHVYMRSNDVWLGTPYDLFNFTLTQQLVAYFLGADVGSYTHTVGSFHLYERNVPAALEALESRKTADVRMPLVRSAPLGLMTAAYAEVATLGPTSMFDADGWTSKWLRALASETDYIQPWANMLRVLAHRFDASAVTGWGELFEVGRQ